MIYKMYTFITLLSIARSNLLHVGTLDDEFKIFVENLILKHCHSGEFIGIFYDADVSLEINVPKFLKNRYILTILHDLITPDIIYNSTEGWIPIPRKKVTDFNIMLIHDVDGLPQILQVAKRISFFSARRNVLVILTEQVDGNEPWIRKIFSQLWKIYIINVGLVFYTGKVNLFTYLPWTEPQEIQNFSDQGINGNIFYNKLKNLHKYPIKILHRGVTVKMIPVIENNVTNYIGVDGMTMRTVIELYNATSDIIVAPPVQSTPCRFISYDRQIHGKNGADPSNETIEVCPDSIWLPEKWRRPSELTMIQYDCDVSFNSKPLRVDLDYRVDSSYVQEKENFCIMIPAGARIPQALSLFFPLEFHMWIAIGLNFVIQFLIYFGIKYCNGTRRSIFYTCFELYRIQLSNVRPCSKESKYSEKYYLLCFVTYSFLISAAYQSVLISFITVPVYKRSMDSIEELEKVDLPLVTSSNTVIDMHYMVDNHTNHLLFKRIQIGNSWAKRFKFDTKKGYLLTETVARYVMQHTDFIDSYGRHLFHVMNECPLPLRMGYQMPRGSPFLEILNKFSLQRIEYGLIEKWEADSLYHLHSHASHDDKYEEKLVKLTMEHLQGAFYILFIGHIIATITFLLELN